MPFLRRTNWSWREAPAAVAAAIKARWVCEQAHQQMKEALGLDHLEGRSWQGLHRHVLSTMIAYAFLQHQRLKQARRKRIHSGLPQPTLPAVRRAVIKALSLNNRINEVLLCHCNPNTALRYLNDITAIWKVNDALTLITDLNYIRDDGFKTTGYGVAQYGVWSVFDWLKVVGRAEVWRDNGISTDNGITHTGFFVGGFPRQFRLHQFRMGLCEHILL